MLNKGLFSQVREGLDVAGFAANADMVVRPLLVDHDNRSRCGLKVQTTISVDVCDVKVLLDGHSEPVLPLMNCHVTVLGIIHFLIPVRGVARHQDVRRLSRRRQFTQGEDAAALPQHG